MGSMRIHMDRGAGAPAGDYVVWSLWSRGQFSGGTDLDIRQM